MDDIMSMIRLFGGNFAPKGYMYCDGTLLPINQYQALFSLLGTLYGGDGKTNFALPKIEPVNTQMSDAPVRYIICIDGIYPNRP